MVKLEVWGKRAIKLVALDEHPITARGYAYDQELAGAELAYFLQEHVRGDALARVLEAIKAGVKDANMEERYDWSTRASCALGKLYADRGWERG